MNKALSPLLQISLCTFGYLHATSNIALAQVTSDGTVNTQVNQNGSIAEITGGETRRGNLFHSFQDFSIPTGNEAFFNNADSISNIFSRVTGGNVSNIDGAIRANGNASLFLINPAGIIFGENARLDIGGSFLGTTADRILFEDGQFSATDLNNPPLLTVNAPIGLGFRDDPAPIANNSTASADSNSELSFDDNFFGLRVPDGKTFALAGGEITADGGGIVAVGGKIELGAVGGSGTLEIDVEDDNIGFSFPDDLATANISLTNNASFLVSGNGGGDITITANNIEILEGSELVAGILEGSQVPNSQAGDIIFNAQNNIRIASSTNNSSGISNQVGNIQPGSSIGDFITQGSAGNIILNSNTFEGSDNFIIASATSGTGDAGQININARESVSLVGNEQNSTGVLSIVGVSATGNGGDVIISTPVLSIANSSLLLSTIGNGNTGDLRIEASDSIAVSGISQFQSTSIGNGNAGNIIIDAPNADVTFADPTTLISTSVASFAVLPGVTPELADFAEFFGVPRTSTGSSGDISVTSRTLALGNGTSFFTSTAGQATSDSLANAGNININVSDSFVLGSNSTLLSNTIGQGDAGNVNITAGGRVAFEGSNNGGLTGIRTTVDLLPDALAENFTQPRQGGDINITADSLSLTNGSQVLSSTSGVGNAGDINVDVDNDVVLDGINSLNSFPSSLQSNVESGAIGNGGAIKVKSKNLSLTNGAQIQTLVRNSNAFQVGGNGIGGSITIDVEETLTIKGFSETINVNGFDNNSTSLISSSLGFGAVGQSGNIVIETDSLSLTEGGEILSSAFGAGRAGNITVDVKNDIVLDETGQSISNGNITTIPSGFFSNVGEFATGDGGNINLTLGGSLELRENSIISAEANNNSDGGNIDINTEFIVAFPNQIAGNGSDIIANAEGGDGGNININAKSLLGIEERTATAGNQTNDIDASSEFGIGGTIEIFTPDINPVQGATELPDNIVIPEQTIAQACQANRELAAQNRLNITGKEGIPPEPGLPLDSRNISVNGQANTTSVIPAPIETAQGKIQPARGIKITESREIILTAYRTNNAGDRIPDIKPNCS